MLAQCFPATDVSIVALRPDPLGVGADLFDQAMGCAIIWSEHSRLTPRRIIKAWQLPSTGLRLHRSAVAFPGAVGHHPRRRRADNFPIDSLGIERQQTWSVGVLDARCSRLLIGAG